MDTRAATPAPSAQPPAIPTPTPMTATVGEAALPPAGAIADGMTTREQLKQAEAYLATLHGDRDESCRELEAEANFFLESPSTPEQERRFRLIYQLVRYQVRFQKLLLMISSKRSLVCANRSFVVGRGGNSERMCVEFAADCVCVSPHRISHLVDAHGDAWGWRQHAEKEGSIIYKKGQR